MHRHKIVLHEIPDNFVLATRFVSCTVRGPATDGRQTHACDAHLCGWLASGCSDLCEPNTASARRGSS